RSPRRLALGRDGRPPAQTRFLPHADKFITGSSCKLDLKESVYLALSYNKPQGSSPRSYQFHSFGLELPENLQWKFSSGKRLQGFDPDHPTEAVLDWYALSGGQLKYYPRASSARFYSEPFSLLTPPMTSILDRAKSYFPVEWDACKPNP
ncbi:hypothetical protein, partial [Planctomicrobium piriforme]|uniref:hypothetical protein n=1 Tax=Planctomicrobium piriforme TaxID=1576369 RepID=UPI001C316ED5